MLDLLLDKDFAKNFHLAYEGDVEYVDDFLKYFLKNLREFKLLTNHSNLEELIGDAKENPLLELIIERLPKLELGQDFKNDSKTSQFAESGSPFKMILTGEGNDACNSLRRKYGFEYFNVQNLAERWKPYNSHHPQLNRKTTLDPTIPEEFRFDSWGKMECFSHPLNSIIIIDFYLLAWKSLKEFETNLKCNIIPLLKCLMSQASEEVPVEILIVSEFNTKIPTPAQSERVMESQKYIEKELRQNTDKKFTINIVNHDKANYPGEFEAFHDRSIITNYFYIESGMGFSLFKENGFQKKVTGNTEMKFRFNFNVQNIYSVIKDLKNLKKYNQKLENHPGRPDYLNFFPDKENRFLNMSFE